MAYQANLAEKFRGRVRGPDGARGTDRSLARLASASIAGVPYAVSRSLARLTSAVDHWRAVRPRSFAGAARVSLDHWRNRQPGPIVGATRLTGRAFADGFTPTVDPTRRGLLHQPCVGERCDDGSRTPLLTPTVSRRQIVRTSDQPYKPLGSSQRKRSAQ